MDCLRALIRIPQAVSALEYPEPLIFSQANIAMMKLMETEVRPILDPNKDGDNFAHIWARHWDVDVKTKVLSLLETTLAPWALSKNKKGESAMSLLEEDQILSATMKARVGKVFRTYELRLIKEEVSKGKVASSGSKAKRL